MCHAKEFPSHQELEQDKSSAISWKWPPETNKAFSERELMSAVLFPSFFRCVLTGKTGEKRVNINKLRLQETMLDSGC